MMSGNHDRPEALIAAAAGARAPYADVDHNRRALSTATQTRGPRAHRHGPAGGDTVVVPAWCPTSETSVELVATTSAHPTNVDVYVTVLPPADPGELIEHGRRLVDAGARGLRLYHLGLASAQRQPLFAQLVTALQGVIS